MSSKEASKSHERASSDKVPEGSQVRTLRAAELFGESRELLLEHNGQTYRLRITANDKLILTK